VLAALLLYTTGYSLFNVPYMAMPAEMTTGYDERSSIHGWRVMFAAVGGFLSQSAAGAVLELMGKDWDAHAAVGALGGALILAAMLTAWWGTREAPFHAQTNARVPLREQVLGFLRNLPFQQILAIKLLQLIGVSASSGGLMFFLVSVIDMPLTRLPLIGGPMVLAVLLGTPLLVRLSKRLGNRGAYACSSVLTGFVGLSWTYAMPGEPLALLALYSLVEKLAAALGPLILGFALAYAGFDPKTPPREVTDEVRQAVLLSIAYIPAATSVLALLILASYKLDEQQLRGMREGSVKA
jgi:GPH family glycoside/pentoside/hexuronide:cation symporter